MIKNKTNIRKELDMPIICFRKNLKIDSYKEKISFAFNCIYNNEYHLKLKDCIPNYFDSGDFDIKVEESINELTNEILRQYEKRNGGVLYMALLNYFYDTIPGLYSVKFESQSGDSIYYVTELKNND